MKKLLLLFVILLVSQNFIAQNFGEGYGTRQFTNDLFLLDEYKEPSTIEPGLYFLRTRMRPKF